MNRDLYRKYAGQVHYPSAIKIVIYQT